MNIIKPQKLKLKELEVSNIKEIQENEQKEYLKFENDECSGIQLYENEFEHCTFSNIKSLVVTFQKIDYIILHLMKPMQVTLTYQWQV